MDPGSIDHPKLEPWKSKKTLLIWLIVKFVVAGPDDQQVSELWRLS